MAVNMFLKLDGIKGESTDDKHKGEIEIESFSWGATQSTTIGSAGGGAGAGKVKFNELTITKKIDSASPQLFLNVANGKHIKTGVLTLAKSGLKATDLITIKLEDVLVSSYQTGGSEPEQPRDAISLNFAKVTFQVNSQKPDGTVTPGAPVGWDVTKNSSA